MVSEVVLHFEVIRATRTPRYSVGKSHSGWVVAKLPVNNHYGLLLFIAIGARGTLPQMSTQNGSTRRRTFAILKSVFAILFVISTAAWTYLYAHYERTSPPNPNPIVGKVYPERHIGVILYLTAGERDLLRWLTAGGFLCFCLGAACYQLEKRSL
jgi:hypothetical protein